MLELTFDGTFSDWKRAAREALAGDVAPELAHWSDSRTAQGNLALAVEPVAPNAPRTPAAFLVPKEFITLAAEASCHADEQRWALLYRLLWRLTHGEAHLLDVAVDPDVVTLTHFVKAVRREVHKMHAFVRFREVNTEQGPWFVAWFEPQHHIVEVGAPFFRDRFAAMSWSILTPERCAHWDKKELRFTAGVPRDAAPTDDKVEELWRTYYGSIFNPARVKIGAMTSEMPRRYWKNLPEAQLIPSLLAAAQPRVGGMIEASEARQIREEDVAPLIVPRTADLDVLRDAARQCRGCPLWKNATCTVFGEGKRDARIVVVGEQPGDQEDRSGQPFVGPAGKLFDRALLAAGVDRNKLYVTNAVKHFKWEPRGKRRLHQKPNAREVAACRPWLEAEFRAIQPTLIVCLGGTAAQSVLGRPVKILSERGAEHATEFAAPALLTVHPSSLLRLPESSDPAAAFDALVSDLQKILPYT